MKLVSVLRDGVRLAGVLEGDEVFVTEIAGLDTAIANGLDVRSQKGAWAKLTEVRLDTPLRPGAIIGTGSNYKDHLDERIPASAGQNAPKNDMEFFIKTGHTVAGLDEPLRLAPGLGAKIDQETEVALVMRPGLKRDIPEASAMDAIFGYLVANDVTARDKQVRLQPDGSNFMVVGASKNFDGATRFSSYVVTADEVPNINALDLRTYLNGELKQNNNTTNLINTFPRIVSFFSEVLTFRGGDVIITGTPGGTGWGHDPELGGKGYVPPGCTPNRYLRPGDVIRSVVQDIGEIVFRAE